MYLSYRHQVLSDQICKDLVTGFSRLDFSFTVGCANGIDSSFRKALSDSDYAYDKTTVAVAYPYRLKKIEGLPVVKLVVPETVHPRTAPRVRTLYMVDQCDMAVVFPDDVKTGSWGKGSTVCINACIKQDKPVFIVTDYKPDRIDSCYVLPTSLFGVIRGYFIVPKKAGVKACFSPELKEEAV